MFRFSILQGWLPIAGDVWSAKQIYVNETHSICSISKEDNQLTVVGMFDMRYEKLD
jgi:hypothetical protein